MDIQEAAETMEKLDEPAETVFAASLRASNMTEDDLVAFEDHSLSSGGEKLADIILSADAEALDELGDEVSEVASVGPLMRPETLDPDTTGRMEARYDAFVEAHTALEEASWDKEKYVALADFISEVQSA
jgi:hypothetical protein